MKHSKSIALTLICILLGIILAWQYKSIDYYEREKSLETKTIGELKDELIREQKNNEDLNKRNTELEAENNEYQKSVGNVTKETQLIKNELERAQLIAGLSTVRGKGIVITVDTDFVEVTESNLLNIINELRASDAQAISINDERIGAYSEIRIAGRQYIMINGRQMRPPFVIKAIADPDKIERALKILGGVLDGLRDLQLNVEIEKVDDLVIPKIRDDGTVIKTDLLKPVDEKNAQEN